MLFLQTDDIAIVTSDGWQVDHQGWEPMSDGTIIEISRADRSVTIHSG
jgi:hypothetical protein